MTKANRSSKTIQVEHVTIASERSFADVRAALESNLPKLDASIASTLRGGDRQRASAYGASGPKLSIFLERDHGSLLEIADGRRNAIQYDIGNPLTASKMTRYALGAALYAPLRVVLFEDSQGKAVFEYDKPSSFFSQFGDDRVTDVGLYLDRMLENALLDAAG